MFKGLLTKLFGGYLGKKAELYDGTPTEGKAWFKSKTVLAGIYTVLRALYEGTSAVLVMAGKPKLPDVPDAVDGIVGTILGIAIVEGRINASKPIVVLEDKAPKDQAPEVK